jgi:hypothetical protein
MQYAYVKLNINLELLSTVCGDRLCFVCIYVYKHIRTVCERQYGSNIGLNLVLCAMYCITSVHSDVYIQQVKMTSLK